MVKKSFIWLLHRFGLFRLLRRLNRNKVIILYLHGVSDAGTADQWRPLRLPHSASVLERQLEIISRHYQWVSIDDAVSMIAGKMKVRPYSIALTFDDGYCNNMTEALPLAQAHGIKPTFYIATGFVNNAKPFWFDRFDFAIQQISEPVVVSMGNREYRFLPQDSDNLSRTYSELRNYAKSYFATDWEFGQFFDEACERIEAQFDASIIRIQSTDKWSATLSDADLQVLSETDQVTIGSHTVDHIRLDKMPAQDCRHQLIESAQYLERVTGTNCQHFCYPNGSVNDEVAGLVAEAGYASAVTTAAGFNRPGDDLFQLSRFHLPDSANEARILSMLSGFFLFRDRARELLRGRRHG